MPGSQRNKLINIAFLMGSGRVNTDVEWEAYGLVGAESAREFSQKMRSASPEQVDAVWKLLKQTPAGSTLSETAMTSFEQQVEQILSEQNLTGIEKERGSSLVLQLETAVIQAMDARPLASPVSVQMMQSLNAVKAKMNRNMATTGIEAVNAFVEACRGHFTSSMSPLSRLVRKYKLDVGYDSMVQPAMQESLNETADPWEAAANIIGMTNPTAGFDRALNDVKSAFSAAQRELQGHKRAGVGLTETDTILKKTIRPALTKLYNLAELALNEVDEIIRDTESGRR